MRNPCRGGRGRAPGPCGGPGSDGKGLGSGRLLSWGGPASSRASRAPGASGARAPDRRGYGGLGTLMPGAPDCRVSFLETVQCIRPRSACRIRRGGGRAAVSWRESLGRRRRVPVSVPETPDRCRRGPFIPLTLQRVRTEVARSTWAGWSTATCCHYGLPLGSAKRSVRPMQKGTFPSGCVSNLERGLAIRQGGKARDLGWKRPRGPRSGGELDLGRPLGVGCGSLPRRNPYHQALGSRGVGADGSLALARRPRSLSGSRRMAIPRCGTWAREPSREPRRARNSRGPNGKGVVRVTL